MSGDIKHKKMRNHFYEKTKVEKKYCTKTLISQLRVTNIEVLSFTASVQAISILF